MKPSSALAALLLTAGTPALAQECNGLGAGGIWIGGNPAESDIAVTADPLDQLALVLAGNAYVSLFSLSAPAEVRLEAQGNGAGDPVIELFDGSGASVGMDDDSGGGTASRLERQLDPGTYCLTMSSFAGTPMTGTVRIGRTEHAALTEGAAPPALPEAPAAETTTPAAPSVRGCEDGATLADGMLDAALPGPITAIAPVGEVTGYAFILAEPAAISITAENEAADPVLSLRDATDTTLYENDDFDGLNSRIDITSPLAPGEYCIALRALSDDTAPVTVTVTGYDPQAAQIMLYDRGEAVPPLDGSYPVEMLGEVSTRVRADVMMQPGRAAWFAVEIAESGLLLVEAIAPGSGDPVLTLFDDLGREVAFNDDSGGGLDAMLAARVLPGTYLIALTDLGGSDNLIRMVAQRYVPAE